MEENMTFPGIRGEGKHWGRTTSKMTEKAQETLFYVYVKTNKGLFGSTDSTSPCCAHCTHILENSQISWSLLLFSEAGLRPCALHSILFPL